MTTEPANKCGLKREDFQNTVNGKKTDLFVLRNKQGNEVAVTNYGGAVVAIMMPDKDEMCIRDRLYTCQDPQ